MHNRTWVEISRTALEANVRTLQAQLGADTTFSACVKGNAYGHDIALTTKALLEIGVTHFTVDSIDEAFVVRKLSHDAVIFIVGMTPIERFREAITAQFVLDIYDEDALNAAIADAVSLQKVALVNVEIETGLHRLGAMPRVLLDLARLIKNNPRNVKLVGLSTHLSSAENPQARHVVDEQLASLDHARADFAAYDIVAPYVHSANSAATILHPTTHETMVRAGIAVYGLWPSQEMRIAVQRGKAFELRPVLAWKCLVAQVKDVPSGGAVGYDRTYVTNRPMRVAVLPVGYYDGYDRKLSSKGKVLLRGRLCPVVGRVCMNMIMVDVSDIPQVKAGDVAVLIGREGMSSITADELADAIGTIHYEVVTRINPNIARIVV
ncbi:MAG: alanine racemase [Patescibacteria group bacterium]